MTPSELEERTARFAQDVRVFMKSIGSGTAYRSDIDQLIRSSGSVAANYIEANEALGRKDFIMRLRICRKEAKESQFWLRMLETGGAGAGLDTLQNLKSEADQLRKIFSAAIRTLDRPVNTKIIQ